MHFSVFRHIAKKLSSEFLWDNNIEVLPWLGNSPDKNPIENLWEVTIRKNDKEIITTKRQQMEKLTND